LLSREELLALVADQAALIDQLRAEVVELRRRLDLNSSNSSRPPSSDGPYGRPRPKSSGMPDREGPRRKPGKQRGAPGRNRRQVPDPDETVPVEPASCTGCGTGLAEAPVLRVFKRQVFEASPPPPPRVIQFDVAQRQCPCCGTVNEGTAPAWAAGRVQWGPGVAARAVLATVGHHLPYERAARLLAQLAGVAVSVGFLVNARRRGADLLAPFMAWVRRLLHTAGLLHVDETTARAGGALTYLHVACNDTFTVMHTGGRSSDDIDAGGVLVDYNGIIVRDGYAGYQHFVDAVHAWCGAHSLRDLKGLHDADPTGQPGAKAMATTLIRALRETKAARDGGATALTDEQLSFLRSCYGGAIKQIREDNHPAKTPLHERGLSLAQRFDTHRDMILRFIDNLAVPFTNNAAEREIRPVKVKQRSGGCWRTLTGLADFAIIWSYLSTAAKHGLDHLDVLTRLFTTGPWLPPEPGPA
jgi:transposase